MSTAAEAERSRRRRVRLTPVRPVPVEFTGDRAGEGPLTWGQSNVFAWVSATPDDLYTILRVEFPVPGVVSVDDVAGAVRALIARHESLRTTYVPGEPPRQRVAAAGVLPLEVFCLGAGPWGPGDRPAAAEALLRWLSQSSDPVRCPVRFAVAVAAASSTGAGDRVIACAAGVSHLAADHDSIEVLKRDFAELLGDPARRREAGPGHQPLDQAELEAAPAGRARAGAALRYLREQTRRVPHWLYAVPGARANGESLAVELSSPAAAIAVRQIAARTRASRSCIVLAAVCAVLARRSGYRELVFSVLSSNRFERRLAGYVGSLAQGSLVTVEAAGRSFDELAGHTWTTVLEASRHARYDMAERAAMDELIAHERGVRIDYGSTFNSLVAESWSGLTAGVGVRPEAAGAALARTSVRWRPMPATGTPIRIGLNQIDGCLRLDVWTGDASLLPRAELELVLLAAERLLVAAARGDVPAARMPQVIGLEPITSSPGRILVDHCWVDAADVRRLLDDAVAPEAARVFASAVVPGSASDRPLVAYLTATGAVRTPEQAHARCLAALIRHPAAITPRYYVICGAAPSDPDDPAAWPPPLAAGSGRVWSPGSPGPGAPGS